MNSSEISTSELTDNAAGTETRNGGPSLGITYLMYHEIDIPGRTLCRDFSGHTAYAVPQAELRLQLQHLKDRDLRGISVGDALSAGHRTIPSVALTFDDGSNTDILAAAPLLEEMDFKATFYVVVGWLGREGYLSRSQLRELLARGFDIGCQTMNHRFLPGLGDNELHTEIAQAKAELEQITGRKIEHFSCPGGFWSRRVARTAESSGYRSVATSRTGVNNERTDPYRLARISIKRGTRPGDFDRICRGEGLADRRIKDAILSIPKFVLGPDAYVRIYSALHRQ